MSDATGRSSKPTGDEATATGDEETRRAREDHPSGWLALTRNRSVVLMVDALLDLPARREFNQTELADLAGVSRQSVSRHLDLLRSAGLVEPVPETGPQRYRFDPESPVSRAVTRLDGAMNEAGTTDD